MNLAMDYFTMYWTWNSFENFASRKLTEISKGLTKYHQNNLKSYNDFEILRTLAQRLRAWQLFVFSNQNGRNSLNFEATKKSTNIFSSKQYLN